MVGILPWLSYILSILWVVDGSTWGHTTATSLLTTFPISTRIDLFHCSLRSVHMMLHVLNWVICAQNLFLVWAIHVNTNYTSEFTLQHCFIFANSFSFWWSTLEEGYICPWEAILHWSVIFSSSQRTNYERLMIKLRITIGGCSSIQLFPILLTILLLKVSVL